MFFSHQTNSTILTLLENIIFALNTRIEGRFMRERLEELVSVQGTYSEIKLGGFFIK